MGELDGTVDARVRDDVRTFEIRAREALGFAGEVLEVHVFCQRLIAQKDLEDP